MVRRCLLAAIVVAVAASAVSPRSAGPWSCARAVYRAAWAHEFFGILDGPVSSFAVASTPLASDGSFALTLPDLLHDPIVAARSGRGSFTLYVLETKGGNRVGSTTLELAAEYPRDLMIAP